jgi:hypothetical protein
MNAEEFRSLARWVSGFAFIGGGITFVLLIAFGVVQ